MSSVQMMPDLCVVCSVTMKVAAIRIIGYCAVLDSVMGKTSRFVLLLASMHLMHTFCFVYSITFYFDMDHSSA